MKNVLEFLEATSKKYPDKTAFRDEGGDESFAEALSLSHRIGTALAAYGRRRAVLILAEKNRACINSMLGAMYAGDYYIVADVHSPEERLQSIAITLQNPVVIYEEAYASLAARLSGETVSYSAAAEAEEDAVLLDGIRKRAADMDTAYILFTSGSTGTPKGTVVSHRALIAYINWVTAEFGFNEETVFGSQTPLYFSMSVTDLYSTIACGCTYTVIPKQHFSFPLNLVAFLNENKINTIYWVPTALSIPANFKAFDVAVPEHLRTVLFAGEVMPVKQLNYWRRALGDGVTFANLFGPTETTDICTFYVVDREFADTDSLPIGRACDNCDVFIIKEDGTEAEAGEEGELYVRSSFMADGYYNNPEKTAEAFVQNPLNTSFPERVYRTGDIVKENERGELIYVSRKDFQIKRSGYRIELGEIEAGAGSADRVKGCACVYDKDTDTLALFYEGGPKEPDAVIEAVRSHVPAYMMPDKFIKLRELPKNANGKIDRRALTRSIGEYIK